MQLDTLKRPFLQYATALRTLHMLDFSTKGFSTFLDFLNDTAYAKVCVKSITLCNEIEKGTANAVHYVRRLVVCDAINCYATVLPDISYIR